MAGNALSELIENQRKTLGSSLAIVGHHYQAEEVIKHVDFRGDSLELARKTASLECENIVFCGVYFMGESAALLSKPGQMVYLPAPEAECSMAKMADKKNLESALAKLSGSGRKIVPLAYVNSTLEVKAVVGKHGGAVCTSANAAKMLRWAMAEGDAVLFLPDANLGLNTANALNLPQDRRHQITLAGDCANIDMSKADKADLLLWPGFCSIHTHFTESMVNDMREKYPGAKVVVHPESTPSVCLAADAAGSTSFIIDYVAKAPDGSTIIIGTELNLVLRLASEHKKRLMVLPLAESACSYMGEVTEKRLSDLLGEIIAGDKGKAVHVADSLKEPAKAALERMLAVCA